MLSPEKKAEIDKLSMRALLYAQRFAPWDDPRFVGDEGEYRMKRLAELCDADPAAYTAASKSIGW